MQEPVQLMDRFEELEGCGKELLKEALEYSEQAQVQVRSQIELERKEKFAVQFAKSAVALQQESSHESSDSVDYEVSKEHSRREFSSSEYLRSQDLHLARSRASGEFAGMERTDEGVEFQESGVEHHVMDADGEPSINFIEIPAGSLMVEKVEFSLPVDESNTNLLSQGSSFEGHAQHKNVSSQLNFDFSDNFERHGSDLFDQHAYEKKNESEHSESYSLSFSLSFEEDEIKCEVVESPALSHRETEELASGEENAEERMKSGEAVGYSIARPVKPQRHTQWPKSEVDGSSSAVPEQEAEFEDQHGSGSPVEEQKELKHSIMSQSTLIEEHEGKLVANSSLIQPQKLPQTISVLVARKGNKVAEPSEWQNKATVSVNKLQPLESLSLLDNENEYNVMDPGAHSPLLRMRSDQLFPPDIQSPEEMFQPQMIMPQWE